MTYTEALSSVGTSTSGGELFDLSKAANVSKENNHERKRTEDTDLKSYMQVLWKVNC